MRKGIKYLLGVGVLALIPLTATAEENKVTFSCPDTALPGETISCKIGASSSSVKFGGMTAKYNLAEGVTYDSITTTYSYPVNTNSKAGFALGDTAGFQKQEIATVKFKLSSAATSNQNYTISLTNISLSDTEYNDHDFDSITETVRIKSSNNNLSTLSVSGGNITFDAATKKYDLTIDAEKTTITATKADEKATVVGTGEKTLKYGLNTFEVKVTSETGVTNVYTLNITRPDNRDTSKDLLKFGFIDNKLDFSKDKFEYALTVENNIARLFMSYGLDKDKIGNDLHINQDEFDFNAYNVKLILNGVELDPNKLDSQVEEQCDENDKCIYKYKGTDEVIGEWYEDVDWFKLPLGELKVGENKLELVMVAENETSQTYTFKITRKDVVKEEGTIKNPATGLFTGLGLMGLVGAVSAGAYVTIKRKNKFPNA